MNSFFKGTKLVFILFLLCALVGGGYLLTKGKKTGYETIPVSRGAIVEEVSVTGRVSADAEVDLAFERSGRVASVPRQVGEHVVRGDTLVRLDAGELLALRAQASANLDYEEAKLAELKKGSRSEDIAVSEAKVGSARVVRDQSQRNLIDKLESAYTVADDVVHNTVDGFFRNPRTANPEVNFPVNDSGMKSALETGRVKIENVFTSWSPSVSSVDASMVETTANLATVKSFLDTLAFAVSAVVPSTASPQATIDAWKLSVSSARTNLNTAISAESAAVEKYRGSVEALRVAEEELLLKQAGPTEEAIRAQEAKIAAVRATIASEDAQIAKMTLIAPFSGVVTKEDAKLGQTITPNIPIVSLASDGKYKLEVNVPEVSIAKVSVGQAAEVTLDAYGKDVRFTVMVSAIDPSETIIEGVPTYKVTLRFTENDTRVRSGMTAHIDIVTAKKEGVLRIPFRAVTTLGSGGQTVRLLRGKDPVEVPVTLGLKGSDSMVEVESGVSEGDLVIVGVEK